MGSSLISLTIPSLSIVIYIPETYWLQSGSFRRSPPMMKHMLTSSMTLEAELTLDTTPLFPAVAGSNVTLEITSHQRSRLRRAGLLRLTYFLSVVLVEPSFPFVERSLQGREPLIGRTSRKLSNRYLTIAPRVILWNDRRYFP